MSEKYEDEVTVLFGQLKEAQNEAFQEGIRFALNQARKTAHLGDFGYQTLLHHLSKSTLYEVPAQANDAAKMLPAPKVKDVIRQLLTYELDEPIISQFFTRHDFTEWESNSPDAPILTREQFCELYNLTERDSAWTETFSAFHRFARDIVEGK